MALDFFGGGGGGGGGVAWQTSPVGHVDSTPNIDFLYQLDGTLDDKAGNYGDLVRLHSTYDDVARVDSDGLAAAFQASPTTGARQQYRIVAPGFPEAAGTSTHLTIACLMRRISTGGVYGITYWDNSDGVNWSLGVNSSKPRAVVSGGSSIQGSTAWANIATNNDWTHVALVITDQGATRDFELYVNGVSEGTPLTGLAYDTMANSPYFLIGGYQWNSTSFLMEGDIRSVIGIADALTAGEVLALSNAALTA